MRVAQDIYLSIAKEFSETPGPRQVNEGDFSGEKFLKELLIPRFEQARSEKVALLVDFDGTEGYATSFLESAFGGLTRKYTSALVLQTIRFKSSDEPFLIEEVTRYIKEANS